MICASSAKRWASIGALGVVIAGAFFFSGNETMKEAGESAPVESAVEAIDETQSSTSSSYSHSSLADHELRQSLAFTVAAPTASTPSVPMSFTHEERASLRTLTSLLSDVTRHPSKPTELIEQLIRNGYEPVISKDSNEYTGSMVIVRTKNTLPGTRYFHAQYFTDESGKYFPQHLSFEFRPGNSMADIVGQVESTFGPLGKPAFANAEWMEWKLPNEYTLWIKKLGAEDLEGDPFNAYSADDVNTIVVAVERDVAGHDDH